MADPARDFSVSVVIPLYNKERAIECTLKSVLGQTRKPEELIIVDDGSTDGSLTVVQRVLSEGETPIDIRVLQQENQGVSAARNRGANESRSAYIAFLDADDEWLPGYLAELERLATAFPEAGVLTIGYARLNRRGEMVRERTALPNGFVGIVRDFYKVYRRGYGLVHTSSLAIARDAWKRSGGFRVGGRTSQDMLLWLKLGLSETYAHSSKPLSIWHEEHTGAHLRNDSVPEHFRYFLGTEEGRRNLRNADLARFLGSNLMVQVANHRVSNDPEVVAELRRLAKVLPLSARLKCWGAARMPLVGVRAIAWSRRRSRELRR